MSKEEILETIRPLLESHFEAEKKFVSGETPIRLSGPTFGVESVKSLLSTYLTMGEKVERFEAMWSEYCDRDYGNMVNSGSSANLLALKVLEDDIIRLGDEFIVPAVARSTNLSDP